MRLLRGNLTISPTKALFSRYWLVIFLLWLAACGTPTPPPNPDGPILNGIDKLPKSLATIAPSPSPNEADIQSTSIAKPSTETPPPSAPTRTPTPFKGIYMGNATFPAGTVVFRGGVPRPAGIAIAALPGFSGSVNPVVPVPGPIVNPTPGGGTSIAALPSVPTNIAPVTVKNCSVPLAQSFNNAYQNAKVQQRLGCPTAPPGPVSLVAQPFQNGYMIWRNTPEIFVLWMASAEPGTGTDIFWRYPDNWNASIPASDPALASPPGLSQPVRGFGLVWRSNAQVKNSLGWALGNEAPYEAVWQTFDHGWMMTGPNALVFALSPTDNPITTGVQFGKFGQ